MMSKSTAASYQQNTGDLNVNWTSNIYYYFVDLPKVYNNRLKAINITWAR